jgi:hypothetical protein
MACILVIQIDIQAVWSVSISLHQTVTKNQIFLQLMLQLKKQHDLFSFQTMTTTKNNNADFGVCFLVTNWCKEAGICPYLTCWWHQKTNSPIHEFKVLHESQKAFQNPFLMVYSLWHYRLWSFKTSDTKLEIFLHKYQHSQRKLLNFENWTNGEPQ